MFINNSTNKSYPKTLHIRNTFGGSIWQVYHVETIHEAKLLSRNATKNYFEDIQLVDYTGEEQTWPDWRDNAKSLLEEAEKLKQ